MSKLIAIIDDEQDIAELLSINLKKNGFATKEFGDAASFFRFIRNQLPDLVILDLMLPDMDGLDICKQLKKENRSSAIPIIMLSAKSDETDKVLGLELGADDYVTKPFSPKELVARVKAALRKHTSDAGAGASIDIGNILKIDVEKYEVLVHKKKVELTTTEFKILQLLAGKKGCVFSREAILSHLWGDEKIVLDRTIDVHIRHLREKLGAAGEYIKNIRSIGYKLEEK